MSEKFAANWVTGIVSMMSVPIAPSSGYIPFGFGWRIPVMTRKIAKELLSKDKEITMSQFSKQRPNDFFPAITIGRQLNSLDLGECKPRIIHEVPGPEDIVVDHERGIAYVSSQLRVTGCNGKINGAIFQLNLQEDSPRPVNVTGNCEEKIGFFHPHGFDLYVAPNGQRRLFVINHRNGQDHCIELFDVDQKNNITYVRRVEGVTALTSPNDLVALNNESFLVVNDHGFRSKIAQSVEDAMRLFCQVGMGTVVQGQLTPAGVHWTTLVTGLGLGAGIEVDKRQAPQLLYVSSASANKILRYQHGQNGWTAIKAIELNAGPDNLTWDMQGRLWTAGHPDPIAFFEYMAGSRKTAPSRVFCIADPMGSLPVAQEVFSDDGRLLSAASVAALYTNSSRSRLLIGGVSGRHLLIYDFPPCLQSQI
jgi:arylesterase/paraoxonase